jgi:hypothetical protein
LAGRLDEEVFERELEGLKLSPWTEAALLAEWFRTGRRPSPEFVARVAAALSQTLETGRRHRKIAPQWVVDFGEMLALHGGASDQLSILLNTFPPRIPELVPHRSSDLEEFDPLLRAACLRAELERVEVEVESLMPDRVRAVAEQAEARTAGDNAEQRRRFQETVGRSIALYQLRARALIGTATREAVAQHVNAYLDAKQKEYQYRFFKTDPQYRVRALVLCETISLVGIEDDHLLGRIADLGDDALRTAAPQLWTEMANQLLRSGSHRPFAFNLIERAAQAIASSPLPASERWQALLRCSEVAEPYDHEYAFDLFRRALAAAEGVDDDSAHLLAVQSRLGRTLMDFSVAANAASISARLARITEVQRKHVSDQGIIPWADVVGTVAHLNPEQGLALAARWDDEAHLPLRTGVGEAVAAALVRGFLLPEESLAFLHLRRGSLIDKVEALLEEIWQEGPGARARLARAVEYVSMWIRRDVYLPSRGKLAEAVLAWAESHGWPALPGLGELRAMRGFTEALPREMRAAPKAYSSPDREAASEREMAALLQSAREGDLSDLSARVTAAAMHAAGTGPVRDFLILLGRSILPGRRIQYLEALTLLEIDPIRWQVAEIAEALRSMLVEWSASPNVRDWTVSGVARFLATYLPGLVIEESGSVDQLRALLTLEAIPNQRRVPILLDAATANLHALGPTALHVLAEVLAENLPPEERLAFLEWSLRRSEDQCGLQPWGDSAAAEGMQPAELGPALAKFFWALFGHPERGMRWRALHAARDLVMVSERPLVRELLQVMKNDTADAFRSSALHFYPFSARVTAFVLLLRLADERPSDLLPFVDEIAQYAAPSALPHAQLRELARRTVLRIAQKVPGSVPAELVAEMEMVNQPKSCKIDRGIDYGASEERDEQEEERFTFDSMDTVPYWYAPVGRLFGMPTQEICRRAEYWIVDGWGRSNAEWWTDQRETAHYEWQQMQNRHGSVPEVENLHRYLEYHAMQCVAGTLADTSPIVVDTWGDAPDTWGEWLREYLPASEEFWLADLRRPTPHRPELWGILPPAEEWLRPRRPEEYETALGLDEPGRDGWMVVAGHWSIRDRERRGWVMVASALVNPTSARALLHALQHTGASDFRLPMENDPGAGDMEIHESGFELHAWLRNHRIESHSEESDPVRRGIVADFTSPGTDFEQSTGGCTTPDYRQCILPDGTAAAEWEAWSDDEEEERIYSPVSRGDRLWMRIDTLLEYLKGRGYDLIVEVQVTRNRNSDDGGRSSYEPGRSRIYLVRRDGTLEALDEHRSLR